MYDPSKIEPKWQQYWQNNKTFKADIDSSKEKSYILDMFPYPSGSGLHVGHPEGYTATDIVARHRRMKGYNVLHPIGWDAFGLPAENYAIKTKTHPKETTNKNINTFRKQIQSIGFSYDWDREINTSSPEYYKWTQWFFLFLYENGLAYKKKAAVNWCEGCKTVLANEQVVNDHCERCDTLVVQKKLSQWFFKITDFIEDQEVDGRVTDGLLTGLKKIDWPNSTLVSQENWIGKSSGAEVDFKVEGFDETIRVYTTRPDTLFGATYMVLAPEHPLVDKITTNDKKDEVEKYQKEIGVKNERERMIEDKEKTGVFTGAYAINPVNEEKIPIWIADYVLMGYGTGAIMAVPAHDERDFEFAKKFRLPLIQVVDDEFKFALRFCLSAFEKRIGKFDDQSLKHWYNLKMFLEKLSMIYERSEFIFSTKFEDEILNFSPQDPNESQPAEKIDQIIQNLYLSWRSPLAQSNDEKIKNQKICQEMKLLKLSILNNQAFFKKGIVFNSGFLDGLSFVDAKIKIIQWLEEKESGEGTINYKLRNWSISRQRYWGAPIPIIFCDDCGELPVPKEDLPVILPDDVDFMPTGVSPLIESKTFHDVKCPKCDKSARRESDTMDTFVCSSWYMFRFTDPHNESEFASEEALKNWTPVDLYVGGAEHTVMHLLFSRFFTKALHKHGYIDFDEPFQKLRHQGMILGEDNEKMSKSRGNVVNPDDVIKGYGADTLRLYEMFIGPFEAVKPWSTKNIEGSFRFLQKVWRIFEEKELVDDAPSEELNKLLHKTIKKVTEDIENFKFNTAISTMMVLANAMLHEKLVHRKIIEPFMLILSPFAPHLAEEIWSQLGHSETLAYEAWPEYDEALAIDSTFELIFSVNGKKRGSAQVPKSIAEKEAVALAYEDENVKRNLEGKEVIKEIYVEGKLVNLVVKG